MYYHTGILPVLLLFDVEHFPMNNLRVFMDLLIIVMHVFFIGQKFTGSLDMLICFKKKPILSTLLSITEVVHEDARDTSKEP